MDATGLRKEARLLAAEHWYRGLRDAVLAGAYDDIGDVVKVIEIALRRGAEIATEMPDGLRPYFKCRGCSEWVEWPAEISDFDINSPSNVCGGSPRCCP